MKPSQAPRLRVLFNGVVPRYDEWDGVPACDGHDPELWFPDHPERFHQRAEAARICATCPVRVTCLEVALASRPEDDFGVWAGTTPSERVAMRRERGMAVCGTDQGYQTHMRAKEAPCAPCCDAHRLARGGRAQPKPLKPHGTRAAEKRHERRRERLCETCEKSRRRRLSDEYWATKRRSA